MIPSYRAPARLPESRGSAGDGTKKQNSTSQVGQALVWLPDLSAGSHGGLSIVNGSESHNDAVASTLSQVLLTGSIQPQYYLSPAACAGILRRAAKRGKTLPERLARALQQVADSEQTSNAGGGIVTHALRGEGFDASEDGTGRGTPLVPVAFGGNNTSGPIDVAATLTAKGGVEL